jgi:hypothetical protein
VNDEIDTSNRAFVGVMGDHVVLPFPLRPKMNAEEAYNVAAWLVTMADIISRDGERFDKVRSAVRNT